MSDIGLFPTESGLFDIKINEERNDIVADNGLETAVIISIWSNRRVKEEELPFGKTQKEGWWGDMYPEKDGDKIGSKLWTLNPEKTTNETLKKSEDYTKECLNWMIDDGIASAINVLSEYNSSKHLVTKVQIVKKDGEEERFSVLWEEQEIRRG